MANTEKQFIITVSDKGTILRITDKLDKMNTATEKVNKTTKKVEKTTRKASKTWNEAKRNLEGTAQRSGSAGKDFARQAQGMGGLVAAYATVAANVFALSATFQVLKKAADFDSMIISSQNLADITGANFLHIAKNAQEASKGALTLAESLTFTNKALSVGVSAKQFEELTVLATKASQTFGGSTTDAMNRFTDAVLRGRTELVNKIGIIISLEDATREYAARLGKTSNELTTFERKQAIVNSILKAGNDTLGDTVIDPNPYQTLITTFQDLKQEILTMTGTFINPFINAINESKLAILAFVSVIAKAVIGKLAPALLNETNAALQAAKKARKDARRQHLLGVFSNAAQKKSFGIAVELENDAARKQYKIYTGMLNKKELKLKSFYDVQALLRRKDLSSFTKAELHKINIMRAQFTKIITGQNKAGQLVQAGVTPTLARQARDQLDILVSKTTQAEATMSSRMRAFSISAARSISIFVAKAKTDLASLKASFVGTFGEVQAAGFFGGFGVIGKNLKKLSIHAAQSGTVFKSATRALIIFGGVAGLVTTALVSLVSILGTLAIAVTFGKIAWDKWGHILVGNIKKIREFGKASGSILAEGVAKLAQSQKAINENFPKFNTKGLEGFAQKLSFVANILDNTLLVVNELDKAFAKTFNIENTNFSGTVSGLQSQISGVKTSIKDISALSSDFLGDMGDATELLTRPINAEGVLGVLDEASKRAGSLTDILKNAFSQEFGADIAKTVSIQNETLEILETKLLAVTAAAIAYNGVAGGIGNNNIRIVESTLSLLKDNANVQGLGLDFNLTDAQISGFSMNTGAQLTKVSRELGRDTASTMLEEMVATLKDSKGEITIGQLEELRKTLARLTKGLDKTKPGVASGLALINQLINNMPTVQLEIVRDNLRSASFEAKGLKQALNEMSDSLKTSQKNLIRKSGDSFFMKALDAAEKYQNLLENSTLAQQKAFLKDIPEGMRPLLEKGAFDHLTESFKTIAFSADKIKVIVNDINNLKLLGAKTDNDLIENAKTLRQLEIDKLTQQRLAVAAEISTLATKIAAADATGNEVLEAQEKHKVLISTLIALGIQLDLVSKTDSVLKQQLANIKAISQREMDRLGVEKSILEARKALVFTQRESLGLEVRSLQNSVQQGNETINRLNQEIAKNQEIVDKKRDGIIVTKETQEAAQSALDIAKRQVILEKQKQALLLRNLEIQKVLNADQNNTDPENFLGVFTAEGGKAFGLSFYLEAEKLIKDFESTSVRLGKGFFNSINKSFDDLASSLKEGNKDFAVLLKSFARSLGETIIDVAVGNMKKIILEGTANLFKDKFNLDFLLSPAERTENHTATLSQTATSMLTELQSINRGITGSSGSTSSSTTNNNILNESNENSLIESSPTLLKVNNTLLTEQKLILDTIAQNTSKCCSQAMGEKTTPAVSRTQDANLDTNEDIRDANQKSNDQLKKGNKTALTVAEGVKNVIPLAIGALVARNQEGFKGIILAILAQAAADKLMSFIPVPGGATGGVLTPKGINGFANGGIVTRPQLAMVREGGQNEAVVPLPNNREIPVDLKNSGPSIVIEGSNYTFTNATPEVEARMRNYVDQASEQQFNRVFNEINRGGKYAKIVRRT